MLAPHISCVLPAVMRLYLVMPIPTFRSAVISFSKGTPSTAFTFDHEDNDQYIYVRKLVPPLFRALVKKLIDVILVVLVFSLHLLSCTQYFNVVGGGVAPYKGNSGGKSGGSDDIAGPIGLVLIFL